MIGRAGREGVIQADDYHRLGLQYFAAREFENAAAAFSRVQGLDSGFHDVSLNLGLSLVRCNRIEEGIAQLESVANREENNTHLLDGLADAWWKKGDRRKARQYGERSLAIKDNQACSASPGFELEKESVPPFRPDNPAENIISFSLFGQARQYHDGALRNAVVAAGLYPGWTCRFYCDDRVPEHTRGALAETGAQLVMMRRPPRPADGLFWRFLVADDPAVVRYLVRDCDSLLNVREKCAVDEWLVSQRLFHVMRDHGSHTATMLAGMWGGVARSMPSLSRLLQGFAYDPLTESRIADQCFLGRIVWP
ncbi:MAG TPA: hypothetical protein ENK49_09565, partial [Gammaproteobacteria bacterium]|nr:hypothetical protein [Gammaproteobacteria bacterium]